MKMGKFWKSIASIRALNYVTSLVFALSVLVREVLHPIKLHSEVKTIIGYSQKPPNIRLGLIGSFAGFRTVLSLWYRQISQ